jgi:hypothetical protein
MSPSRHFPARIGVSRNEMPPCAKTASSGGGHAHQFNQSLIYRPRLFFPRTVSDECAERDQRAALSYLRR